MPTTQTKVVGANIETLQSNVRAGYNPVPTLVKENYPLIDEGQKYVYSYGVMPKDKPTSPTTLKIINCKGVNIETIDKVAKNVANFDMVALAKIAKKSKRKSSHKANVEIRRLNNLGDNSIFKEGALFYGVLTNDLVPLNMKGSIIEFIEVKGKKIPHKTTGTTYLLRQGKTVLIERKVGGWYCYDTNLMVYSSIDAVRKSCHSIKVQRLEFKPLINKKVVFSQKGKGTNVPVTLGNVFKYVK